MPRRQTQRRYEDSDSSDSDSYSSNDDDSSCSSSDSDDASSSSGGDSSDSSTDYHSRGYGNRSGRDPARSGGRVQTSGGGGIGSDRRPTRSGSPAQNQVVVKENGLLAKKVMDGYRKEILKFWKDIDVKSPNYLKFLAKDASKLVRERALEKARENGLEDGVRKWAKDIVYKLAEKMAERFGGVITLASASLKDIINQFASVVLSNVLNISSPVKNVIKGLKTITEKFIAKIVKWRKSALIRVGDGHPKVLCDAIDSAISKSLLSEMDDLAYNAVSVVGVIASCGIAEVVTGVVDAISAMGKFIWRCLERRWIMNFIQECGNQYNQRLYENKEAFAVFLRSTTQYVPFVAAVTLHTGRATVGDMGHFFMFITADGKKLDQKSFNATVHYIDKARISARKLIEESNLELRSKNSTVQKILDNHVNDDNFHVGYLHHIDVPKGSPFDKKKHAGQKKWGWFY